MTSESFKAYDLTPKGEGETSFKAVWMANRSERALYLARALRRSVTDFATVLFIFLVKEFREGAAKKQFRFIYDEYLTDAGQQNHEMND